MLSQICTNDNSLILARDAIEHPLFLLKDLTDKYLIVASWAVARLELTEQDLMDYYADKYGVDIHVVIGEVINLTPELLSK